MDAKQYIDEYGAEKAEEIALASGTNLAYFRQIASGHRNCGKTLAKRLCEHACELDLMSLIYAKEARERREAAG